MRKAREEEKERRRGEKREKPIRAKIKNKEERREKPIGDEEDVYSVISILLLGIF